MQVLIRVIDLALPSTKTDTLLYPEIESLICKFSSLFQIPTTLPPSRITNHTIHLLPNSDPVNAWPYRYPYYQKQEIEAQVESMFRVGSFDPT